MAGWGCHPLFSASKSTNAMDAELSIFEDYGKVSKSSIPANFRKITPMGEDFIPVPRTTGKILAVRSP